MLTGLHTAAQHYSRIDLYALSKTIHAGDDQKDDFYSNKTLFISELQLA